MASHGAGEEGEHSAVGVGIGFKWYAVVYKPKVSLSLGAGKQWPQREASLARQSPVLVLVLQGPRMQKGCASRFIFSPLVFFPL